MRSKNVSLFLKNLLAVILLTAALDFIIGQTLRHFYFTQRTGLDYETMYAMETTKADVLIFGSSKGSRQYPPGIFEKRLGLSCYNVSREGYFMLYHEALLKSILKRHIPKVIVLDVRDNEFQSFKDNYEELSVLLPFYKTHPEIRRIVNMRSKYEKLKLISSIYPFNSMMFKILAGNTDINKDSRTIIKGYQRIDNVWNKPLKPAPAPVYNVDSNNIRSYKNFIAECIDKNIRLIIVTTPYLNKQHLHSADVELAGQVAADYNIPFLDYSHEQSLVSQPQLFADPVHLNNTGAGILSNMVIDSLIKNILFQKGNKY